MNDEQIKEVMRLSDEVSGAVGELACSTSESETYESIDAARAAIKAYLRTIGEPESVNAELLEALKSAKNWLEWYQDAHPESASEYDNEAMQEIDAAIARAESAIETPAKISPCAGHAVQQDADEAKICATCRFLTKNGGCQSKGTSYNCVDYCQWEANEAGGA